MGKLIESDDLGNWALKGVQWNSLYVGQVITEKIYEKLYGALCKLKDYEETGLSPEQVESVISDIVAFETDKRCERCKCSTCENEDCEDASCRENSETDDCFAEDCDEYCNEQECIEEGFLDGYE